MLNLSTNLRSLSDTSFENGLPEQAKPTFRLKGKPKRSFWWRQLPRVLMTQPLQSWRFWRTRLHRVNKKQPWTFPLWWLTQRRPIPAMSGAHTEREMLNWKIIEDKGSRWFLDSEHNCCNIRWSKTQNGTWSVLPMTLWQSTGWSKRLSWARRRINTISQRSGSSSRWDFHFHSYVLIIYVRLYWILELLIFYSLVRRGYIRKVSVQLVQKYFSRVCSTDSISCSERKNWKKKRLKQGSKIKEGKSNRCCRRQSTWLIIALLSNRYRYTVALLLLRCCTAIAPLSLRCHYAAVAPLSRSCRTVIAPLSLHCRTDIAMLLLCCRSAVATLLHRYCSAVATPLLLRCRS